MSGCRLRRRPSIFPIANWRSALNRSYPSRRPGDGDGGRHDLAWGSRIQRAEVATGSHDIDDFPRNRRRAAWDAGYPFVESRGDTVDTGWATFGVFVSRNCGGGFLAICLAASLGLSTWAFNRPRQKDHRYAYAGESPALRIMRVFEDTLAQLTTTQIACVIANAMIVAFIVGSNSRGAMASAAAAALVVLLVGRMSSHSIGRWIFATIVIILCLSFAVFFSLNGKATERFAELASAETLDNELKQGRLYIWGVALKTFGWFWATGSGLGTFHFAHHPFQNPITNIWYYHAESLYLQGLVDLGWIAGVLAVTLIWIAYRAIAQVGAALPNVRAKAKEVRLTFEPVYAMGIALIVSQCLQPLSTSL